MCSYIVARPISPFLSRRSGVRGDILLSEDNSVSFCVLWCLNLLDASIPCSVSSNGRLGWWSGHEILDAGLTVVGYDVGS